MKGTIKDLPTMVSLPDGSAIKQIEWGGMSVELGSFNESADSAPFFAGLPDDRCQCQHWGYVLKGEITIRYADRTEVFQTGDAYYISPGHLPVIGDGAEWVEFTPADQAHATMEVLGKNMQAAGLS
jgi:hypothetical protein